ncbi:MAG: hypothetical protein HeimC2_36930 [Candidatus Heimdallarchaeota archaeon LC_2]|nr:MAG: hypothetical protein HeimC2_44820 [Candidatus Heimdallarchaeota archaeon LC_2]OLS20535.1 MAG: hypothetical protein HeimC2_36930 [Candidatus Heimdallarchaeota archaeon LC_2]
MTEVENWELDVDMLTACNCNYGCPCTFQAPPTYGTCEGVIGYQVKKGSFKGLNLEGQKWVLAVRWPGAIHELNGVGVILIDEGANEEQKAAIEEIATGKAGGPLGIFMSTVNKGVNVETVKVDLHVDGKDSWLKVDESIDVKFAPIRSVTGDEQRLSSLIPDGMLTKKEDFYSADTFKVNLDDMEMDFPKRNAIYSLGEWKGP